MSMPADGYEIRVDVRVYRRNSGEAMGLTQNWNVDAAEPSYVSSTLAEFAKLAEQIKAREVANGEHRG